ncbi:hypothetical protein ABKV19_018029 [Rosa sericea]
MAMAEALAEFRRLYQESGFKSGSSGAKDVVPAYRGLIPSDATRDNSALKKKFASMEFSIPPLPAEFGEIPALQTEPSKDDFADDEWKDQMSIVLKRIPDSDVVIMGKELFRNLSHGVSQRHVGSIFMLAFQLRKPGNGTSQYLFPEMDELHDASDLALDSLDNTPSENAGAAIDPVESGDMATRARGYAYLAASFLKMFSRSPEDYHKSWTHINQGYKKFYYNPCPITGISPDPSVVKTISTHFSLSDLFKASLYRLLYNANRDGNILNLQKYLYDTHLSNTGMHVVPIAYRICMAMNCSPADLIRVINANRFRPQILGLIAAFKLMRNTDATHKRMMWKYGRIFDSSFLSALQTRSCPKFVYLLACVLKREASKSASGILEIRQLEEVSPEDKAKLYAGSSIIVQGLRAKASSVSLTDH